MFLCRSGLLHLNLAESASWSQIIATGGVAQLATKLGLKGQVGRVCGGDSFKLEARGFSLNP